MITWGSTTGVFRKPTNGRQLTGKVVLFSSGCFSYAGSLRLDAIGASWPASQSRQGRSSCVLCRPSR